MKNDMNFHKNGKNEWDEIYKNHRLKDIPWHTEKPDRRLVKLVKERGIEPGDVLDMCCGAGTNSLYLSSKGFKVSGVDISPTAVNIVNQRCSKKGLKCNYIVGDVLKAKFKNKFDSILDRGCFHHIAEHNKPKYVIKLKSLLRSKGKVYLKCFSDKNFPFLKNSSKKDIYNYFSKYFNIVYIKDSVYTEPSGIKRYFYDVFMERK